MVFFEEDYVNLLREHISWVPRPCRIEGTEVILYSENMRRPAIFGTTDNTNMTKHKEQHHEVDDESHYDWLRNLLSSPFSKKRLSSHHVKTFGVPLDILIENNSSQSSVPFVINRLCQYIIENGLKHEGIFREGGNAYLIDKLKISFDQTGDASLETEGDVPSAASLLKLFLWELPEPVVPFSLCTDFLYSIRDCRNNREECSRMLKCLLEKIPPQNFHLLKYLSQFLQEVASHEDQNKMGPCALSFVFGPNLFRFSDGMTRLKDQSVINQLIGYFITDYYAIFEENSQVDFLKMKETRQRYEQLLKEQNSKLTFPLKAEKLEITFIPASVSLEPLSVISPLRKYFTQQRQAPSLTIDRIIEKNLSQRIMVHLFNEDVKKSQKLYLSQKRRHKEEEEPSTSRSISIENLLNQEPQNMYYTSIAHHSNQEMTDLQESTGNMKDKTNWKQLNISLSTRCTPSRHLHCSLNTCSKIHTNAEQEGKTCSVSEVSTVLTPQEDSLYSDHDKENVNCTEEYTRSQETLDQFKMYSFHGMSGNRFNESVTHHTLRDHPHLHGHNKPHHHHHHYHHYKEENLYHNKEFVSHPILKLHTLESSDLAQSRDDHVSTTPWEDSTTKEIPTPLDFTSLYEECGGAEPVLSEHCHSWPPVSLGYEGVQLSPSLHYLRKENCQDLDPIFPPSPPNEQELFRKRSLKFGEEMMTVKYLNKKIHMLKKKIRNFEETFESQHGFRPSQAEKMKYSEVKKLVQEINKARKELKCDTFPVRTKAPVFEEEEIDDNKMRVSTSMCENTLELTVEDSLEKAFRSLSEKRQLAERPHELENMTNEQVKEEKVDIQKALLKIESIHGRPSLVQNREVVRPLYDHYRKVKRLVARNSLQNGTGGMGKDTGLELQPILEHVAMDFTSLQPREECTEKELSEEPCKGRNGLTNQLQTEIQDSKVDVLGDQDTDNLSKLAVFVKCDSSNLHELSLPELLYQQHQAQMEKKRLRRILREFEEEFHKMTGRKVHKEDRSTMESTYGDYKQVKARLRLLEALMSKHEHRSVI
ncbi:protein FAM13A-like isoform X2 [Tachypleus tridentatus]|uniref:protein FAM13A-like isoform X2 n=1 Tax=Tachypleus tridentatus TaxID=6853 RepID=UPI003FD0E634